MHTRKFHNNSAVLPRTSCQEFVIKLIMAGAAGQAGDAGSSRAPGLASGLQGSVIVRRGALLLVPQ